MAEQEDNYDGEAITVSQQSESMIWQFGETRQTALVGNTRNDTLFAPEPISKNINFLEWKTFRFFPSTSNRLLERASSNKDTPKKQETHSKVKGRRKVRRAEVDGNDNKSHSTEETTTSFNVTYSSTVDGKSETKNTTENKLMASKRNFISSSHQQKNAYVGFFDNFPSWMMRLSLFNDFVVQRNDNKSTSSSTKSNSGFLSPLGFLAVFLFSTILFLDGHNVSVKGKTHSLYLKFNPNSF